MEKATNWGTSELSFLVLVLLLVFLTVLDKLFLFSALFSLPYLYMVLSIYTVGFPTPGIIPGIAPQNNFWIWSGYNK